MLPAPTLPQPTVIPKRRVGSLQNQVQRGSYFTSFDQMLCAAQCLFSWLIYWYRAAEPADRNELALALPYLSVSMLRLLNNQYTHSEALMAILPRIYTLESWNSAIYPLRLSKPTSLFNAFFWMFVALTNSLCSLLCTWDLTCPHCDNVPPLPHSARKQLLGQDHEIFDQEHPFTEDRFQRALSSPPWRESFPKCDEEGCQAQQKQQRMKPDLHSVQRDVNDQSPGPLLAAIEFYQPGGIGGDNADVDGGFILGGSSVNFLDFVFELVAVGYISDQNEEGDNNSPRNFLIMFRSNETPTVLLLAYNPHKSGGVFEQVHKGEFPFRYKSCGETYSAIFLLFKRRSGPATN